MSRRKIKYRTKFFQFSPGIPWKIGKGSTIIPEIDYLLFKEILNDKNVTVVGYGGLIESFFSLSILESLSITDINCNLFWQGNNKYYDLVRAQGIAKPNNIGLTKELVENYPVPLFLDQLGNVYINYLNNYLIKKSYWGEEKEIRKEIIFKQIFDNSLMKWNGKVPKFRNLDGILSEEYNKWLKLEKMRKNEKFILLFPDECDSLHSVNCFDWDVRNIREFSAMMHGFGISVVVCSENIRLLHGINVHTISTDNILTQINLIKNAWMVLSRSIDWHLIALCISKATLVLQNVDGVLDIFKNAEFVDSESVMLMSDAWLSPIEIYKTCQGIKDG